METQNQTQTPSSWLDLSLGAFIPRFNIETLMVTIVLIVTVVSRFYNVDLRVMSHDEVNHVVPSYELFQGRGYRHDPVTHGPMQFHLVALSYFLMGDNDFSSRTPAALFSIATVAVVLLAYRRYIGRNGALIAGMLFMISPFLLFYGRYTRNEAFCGLFAVLTLYGTLRYLEKGDRFSIYLITVVTALHFATKEVSFIYAAQQLLFLGIVFFDGVLRAEWNTKANRSQFVIYVGVALLLLGVALGLGIWNANLTKDAAPASAAAAPAGDVDSETGSGAVASGLTPLLTGELVSILGALAAGVMALLVLHRSLGWEKVRAQKSFDLIVLVGTLILPQLSAFGIKLVGWNPLDYSTEGLIRTSIFVSLFAAISVAIGLWWKPRLWLTCAAIFYAIFMVLYTTFFTNGQGFFTGMVGSLGYWLSQQGVERGSQPWYYYGLIEIPMYEYLAALGALVALYFGLRFNRFASLPGISPAEPQVHETAATSQKGIKETVALPQPVPSLALFFFWTVTALVAYSIAGEKMPWLTFHIAVPLLLTAGWGLGYLVDTTNWKKITEIRGLVALLLMPIFLTGLGSLLGSLLGNQPPFQGNTLEQLQSTSTFLLALVATLASGAGVLYLMRNWDTGQILRLLTVVFFIILTVLTVRTSYRANYIDYDQATEYLVYAHAARGPKDVLKQIEEISRRTTRGKDIVVAYDNDGLYPYWWYLRDYPNHKWYTDKPTRELRDAPLIVAGDSNWGKLDSIVKDNYIYYEYIRLWWPNQDYFNLTWERLWGAISSRDMRAAIFKIWLNRDYSLYSQLTNNQTLKVETWQPSARMRFYIRKDIISQIWNYGAAPAVAEATQKDPYEAKVVKRTPDKFFGFSGNGDGQFQSPRGLAVAQDGSIYVADSRNHRIQHLSADGQLIGSWGKYADASKGDAPGGTFNEPWGVAVGKDGSVYVSDTWNHRVQKFTADGQFVKLWGFFGQAESPESMWGPRGVALDSQDRVYISDTGNKRILIFDKDGTYISQFGTAGMELGQLDEPVGLAIDEQDNIYVADTWNQRVQVFAPGPEGISVVTPLRQWETNSWFGQSLDNKPFIAVDKTGNVYITDPDGYRVLEYSEMGEIKRVWGDFSPDTDGFGLPSGIAVDPSGGVWVSDAGNNRILHFPEE